MERKRRILFCANTLCVGGIETALINLLNQICDDYDVTLCLEHKKGELLNDLPKNVKVIDYKLNNNANVIIRKFINFSKRIKWYYKYHNTFDFSCSYATYSLMCSCLALMSSKNNAIYIHGNNANYMDENEFQDFYDARNIRDFNNIIFVSNESKDDFINIYPTLVSKCQVINNIINYKKVIELSKEKIDYKMNKNDITFLYVGRLEEKTKRISLLLDTFKDLINHNKNIKLIIVGDGDYYEKAKTYIKDNDLNDNITMIGYEKNPYPYMKKCDYIILTSVTEGFPVVFLEAITLNKPIISTLNISDNNISINNVYGYIVNENSIVQEIEEIISKKDSFSDKLDIERINHNNITCLEKIMDGDNNEI